MTPSRKEAPHDTPTTKDQLLGALQKGALLVAILTGAWAFAREVGSSKLDVTTYVSDRRADSLIKIGEARARAEYDTRTEHRMHMLFCKVLPQDSECKNNE